MNIASTDSNREVLKKYVVWSGIKTRTEKINDDKSGKYGKDYIKIRFNSNDDLPSNKQLKFLTITITVRNYLHHQALLYKCKEEPDDVNNFTKSFTHILNLLLEVFLKKVVNIILRFFR